MSAPLRIRAWHDDEHAIQGSMPDLSPRLHYFGIPVTAHPAMEPERIMIFGNPDEATAYLAHLHELAAWYGPLLFCEEMGC